MEISAPASGFETCVSAVWLKAATWFLFWEHTSQCQCLFFTTTHVLKAAKTISLLLLSHAKEKHLALVGGRWLNMDFWMIAGHAQGSRSCSPLRAAIHQDWTAAVYEHQIFCSVCHAHLLPHMLLMFKARRANTLTHAKNTPINFIGCLQFAPWLRQVAVGPGSKNKNLASCHKHRRHTNGSEEEGNESSSDCELQVLVDQELPLEWQFFFTRCSRCVETVAWCEKEKEIRLILVIMIIKLLLFNSVTRECTWGGFCCLINSDTRA